MPLIKEAANEEVVSVTLAGLGALSMFANEHKGDPVMDTAWKHINAADKAIAAAGRRAKLGRFAPDVMTQARIWNFLKKQV